MSTAGRPPEAAPDASDVAARLETAAFVRLVGAATGDGLAATAQLARALDAAGVPFLARLAPLGTAAGTATDADLTVTLGRDDLDAEVALGLGRPASAGAYAVASALAEDTADPVSGLAGAVLADGQPDARLQEDAEAAGIERRPGVGLPTPELADGLAHSTLVHAPFSGEVEAARDELDRLGLADADLQDLDADAHRRLASAVALTVAASGPPAAAEAVERALRPYAAERFETVAGFGDVLDAVARETPGRGLAALLGSAPQDGTDAGLLETWRDHGKRAHAAVAEADLARHDGLVSFEVGADAPLGTVARLMRDFRSPEPVVAAVADGTAVVTARDDTDLGDAVRKAVAPVGGTVAVAGSRAHVTLEGPTDEFVDGLREAL